MTVSLDSQNFESYVPVYDVIPDKWDEARPVIVEQLKKLANGINIREIGWYLDQELLSGKAFIPGATLVSPSDTAQQYRTILRKVIPFPGLVVGLNQQPHEIFIDGNFTLMQLYAAATNATAFTGEPIPNNSDSITYDATNINITVSAAYTRCYAVIEYIVEL